MHFGRRFAGLILGLALLLGSATQTMAADESFVTIVQPVRGQEFWQTQGQTPASSVKDLYHAVSQRRLPATWLLRYDALNNQDILQVVKSFDGKQEVGAFLEVTPTLAQAAQVPYNQSPAWHLAQSVLLIGYQPNDRKKLIDAYFTKYKETFNTYPISVGAWWIDADSLRYMQEKYGISGSLIVADQYSTDNYQIWGQYWSSPYYPSRTNTLIPASTAERKIPLVITQWATRDPYNGYGNGVYDSTYSVQANDYLPYHHLGIDYFTKLVDIYTQPIANQYGFVTIGIENDYSLSQFGDQYTKQLDVISQKQQNGQFRIVSQKEFSNWYKNRFPDVTQPRVISADDPLGRGGKVAWYQNTSYRAGWFYDPEKGSLIRDLRPYLEDAKEPCLEKACTELNFATSATRVLDEVTFGEQALIDFGMINNFSQSFTNGNYKLSYTAASNKNREITFGAKDIMVDKQSKAIDTFILDTQTQLRNIPKTQLATTTEKPNWLKFIVDGLFFLAISLLLFFFSVWPVTKRLLAPLSSLEQVIVTLPVGMAMVMLVAYIAGFVQLTAYTGPVLVVIGLGSLALTIKDGLVQSIVNSINGLRLHRNPLIVAGLIVLGSLFQLIPIWRSGWQAHYGLGFWGPNGHDALWHIALIEQLKRTVPPENPIFGGTMLHNYHYFYDLLLAVLSNTSGVGSSDLYFRFFPLVVSILFGTLIAVFVLRLTKSYVATYLALFFAYTAGSFGYIVSFLHGKGIFGGGESAFWANQAISFHLNEPFALSAVFLVTVLLLLQLRSSLRPRSFIMLLTVIAGVLIEIKVYAGLLVIAGLIVAAAYEALIYRRFMLTLATATTLVISLLVFFPSNVGASSLVVLSPWWMIHNMTEANDRVDWPRLYNARYAYFERGQWVKFTIVETIGLVIFWLGNLGMRIVGVIYAKAMWMSQLHKKALAAAVVFEAVVFAAGMVIPIVFIQKATAWNTIQFIYYPLLLSAIWTGIALAWLYHRFKNKIIALAVIVVVCLLSLPTNVESLANYLSSRPPSVIPQPEVTALQFLAKQPYGLVISYPYNERLNNAYDPPIPLFAYTSTGYVSAYSQKPTFLEDMGNNEIIGQPVASRLAAEREFFRTSDQQFVNEFLQSNNIRYIYLPRNLKDHLDEGFYGVKKIYESDAVLIYEKQ